MTQMYWENADFISSNTADIIKWGIYCAVFYI